MRNSESKVTLTAADGLERATEGAQNLVESKDRVVDDFKALLGEGESLFKSAAGSRDQAPAAARDQFKQHLAVARARYVELREATVAQARHAAGVTDEYVHRNSWRSMAVAGSVGLLVGMLITSRRER